MEQSLLASKANLTAIGVSTEEIVGDISEIRASLAQAKQVIGDYESVVATLRQEVQVAQNSLPALLDQIAWGITIAFVWLRLT